MYLVLLSAVVPIRNIGLFYFFRDHVSRCTGKIGKLAAFMISFTSLLLE